MISSIPCPECGADIAVDVNLLLSGQKFTCSKCQTAIQQERAGHNLTDKAMDQFKRLKDQMTKDEGNKG